MTSAGGIEAGGTKFICGAGTGPEDLYTAEFPTTTPRETIERVAAFFREHPVESIGIGSFGPVDLNPNSPTYGYITTTPKLPWRQFDLVGAVKAETGARVCLDTDVNAAAVGEHRWGAARGLHTFVYLTVGTGIGGGGMVNGQVMHGLLHPEMGHIRIPHDFGADAYPGGCPSHGDCLEGLAAGPTLQARYGIPGYKLAADHIGWELESHYLALGLVTWICTLSPQRIILGGGVMQQADLFPKIRRKVLKLLNGYIQVPEILERIDEYIVPAALAGKAGVLGAIALAGM